LVAKLNPTGTALIFSTYLGGSAEDRVNDVQMDAQGNIWVSGATASTDFPGIRLCSQDHSSPKCRPMGPRLLASQRTPAHAAGQAIRTGDAVTVLGVSGSVLQVPGSQVHGVAVFGIASAAGNRVKAYVAPGEFVSLYGSLLGARVSTPSWTAKAGLPTSLPGCRCSSTAFPRHCCKQAWAR
jgi:hypothetical protein